MTRTQPTKLSLSLRAYLKVAKEDHPKDEALQRHIGRIIDQIDQKGN